MSIRHLSIRQLIVAAFALTFLVSVFACAPPDVNELEDPPESAVSGKSVSCRSTKTTGYALCVTAWVPNSAHMERSSRSRLAERLGSVTAILAAGDYLECRFRDPNTPVLVNRYDKITVVGTVESIERLGRHDYVLHMVDCEMDAGG